MDCAKYKDWLNAAALDALDAGRHAEWQAHLESCAACRAELERRRQFLTAMDQAVARTTEGEPSPAFATRVRKRIEDQPAAANWFAGWLPATASALAVLALVVWMWNRQEPVQAPDARPPVVAEKPPVQVPPAQEAAAEIAPQPPKVRAVRTQPAPVIERTQRVPEVLIPRDEREGLRLFLAASQTGRARVVAESAARVTLSTEPIESPDLVIAPIQFEKIEVTPILQNGQGSQTK